MIPRRGARPEWSFRCCNTGLLRTYCNRKSTTRQIYGLVAESRGQVSGAAPPPAPRPPRSARAGKQLPAETERAIVAEYKAGHVMKEIAARHSLHRVTGSELLDQTGTARWPKGMSSSQVDVTTRLYESGFSLISVGAQLGFNAATVRTMLLRHGITTLDSHGNPQ